MPIDPAAMIPQMPMPGAMPPDMLPKAGKPEEEEEEEEEDGADIDELIKLLKEKLKADMAKKKGMKKEAPKGQKAPEPWSPGEYTPGMGYTNVGSSMA